MSLNNTISGTTVVKLMEYSSQVESLLLKSNLPISDLPKVEELKFFGIFVDEKLAGVVGLELHDSSGLLRSLAVEEEYKNKGFGKILVGYLEGWALNHGIKKIYLLTLIASEFFRFLGYETIPRSQAPDAIAKTTQFCELCPCSSGAILMRKVLEYPNIW